MRRLLPALLLLAACADTPLPGDPGDGVCHRELQKTAPVWQPPSVDVLFVVDRSASMADDAARIEDAMRALAARLESGEAGPPDLHVGVVSSDLGAGGVAGCTSDGDGARLLGGERCGLDGSFLRWRRLADGSVEHNSAAGLADTLACLVDLAPACPVNQPLAAAIRALDGSVAANAGFRRSMATPVIVLLTDGDDCSLGDVNALAGLDSEAAVDFACFERGVMCAPDDPAAPGVHRDCVPRPGAGLLDPRNLSLILHGDDFWPRVVGIFGGAETEVVAGPALAASCTAPDGGTAGPALRLTAATSIASDDDLRQDLCSSSWVDPLAEAILYQPVPIPGYCLEPEVDLDPAADGVQADCVVSLNHGRDDGTLEHVQTLPTSCAGLPPGEPCLDLAYDPMICLDAIELDLHWGDFRRDELLVLSLSCRLACEPSD